MSQIARHKFESCQRSKAGKALCAFATCFLAMLAASAPGLTPMATEAYAEEMGSVTVKVIGPGEQGFYVPWTGSPEGETHAITDGMTALDATRETRLTEDGKTFTYTNIATDENNRSTTYTVKKGASGSSHWTLKERSTNSSTYVVVSNPSTATVFPGEELVWYYDDGSAKTGTATLRIVGPNAQDVNYDYLPEARQSVSTELPGLQNGWDFVAGVCSSKGVTVNATDSAYGKFVTAFTDPHTGKSRANAGTGTNARYWSLYVNGNYSHYGISNVYIRPGDSVSFVYTQAPSSSTAIARSTTVTMYRVYNPNSGEHFYTKDASERRHLISLGWHDEGVGWYAPQTGNPVYRLYNANGGEHHYTLSSAERDSLVRAGWSYEGIGWYSDKAKAVPLYREYNPNAFSCNHNYTTSRDEHSYLVSIGWKDEGIGWYGVKKD